EHSTIHDRQYGSSRDALLQFSLPFCRRVVPTLKTHACASPSRTSSATGNSRRMDRIKTLPPSIAAPVNRFVHVPSGSTTAVSRHESITFIVNLGTIVATAPPRRYATTLSDF